MPKQFDATMKELAQNHPDDFRALMRLRASQPLRLLNVDLSTLTAATDIILAEGDPPTWILDLNFQSGPPDDARELMYNAVLYYQYRVPVHSVIMLLRPSADRKRLTGKVRYVGRKRRGKMDFTYEILRLWRLPAQRILEGGLGTLPLAPLCKLPAAPTVTEALAPVIREMNRRLEEEADPQERARLLSAAYILTGLRVSRQVAKRLYQGVLSMRESSTYQAILDEGREEGREQGREQGRIQGIVETLRKTVLRLGQHRFGPASKSVQNRIMALTDLQRLERMTEKVLEVASWQELLAAP